MKNRRHKVVTLPILFGTLSVATIASKVALASLPYIGPDKKACLINQPNSVAISKIDAGYLTDENCTTLFIKPPVIGKLQDARVEETLLAGFCSSLNSVIEFANELFMLKIETEKEDASLLERLKKSSSQEERASILKELNDNAEILKVALRHLSDLIDLINEQDRPNVAATLTGNLLLNQNSIISAYGAANPHMSVKALPLQAGIIDAQIYSQNSAAEDDFNIFDKLSARGVISSRVGGLKVSELKRQSEATFGKSLPFPDFISNLSGESKLMGQATSVQLVMNTFGYCASHFKKGGSTANARLWTYLAPSYTYFYPVQTKSLYSIELNKPEIFQIVKNKFLEKGTALNTFDIYSALSDRAVKIKLTPGLFMDQSDAEALRTDYEEGLKKMAIDEILSRVSLKIDKIYRDAQYIEKVPKMARACKQKRVLMFSTSVCHNYKYYVDETRLDEAQFNKNLDAIINRGGSAQAEKYFNQTLFDTSVFLPEVQN